METRKINLKIFLLLMSILLSIISQITLYQNILSNISYFSWIITLLSYIFINNYNKLNITKMLIFHLILILVLIVFCEILGLSGFNHSIKSARLLIIPIIPYLIGINLSKDDFSIVAKVYILACTFLAIWININYFSSLSVWSNSFIYIYPQKNSAAQMLCSSIILLSCDLSKKRTAKFLIIVYLLFMICLMQCRTAILSIVFAYFVLLAIKNKKIFKYLLFLFLLLLIIYSIPQLNRFISHVFLLDKYSNMSINSFSSGRIELYSDAILNINNNLLLGVGNYYIDNLYLCLIANYGIIVGMIIIAYLVIRLVNNIYKNDCINFSSKVAFLLSIYYIITSFLEGNPPFGPGVSTLLFWIISGLNDQKNRKRIE